MSDLHQAVQAEIAAHTPTRPPSFDALKARKHRRDRNRSIAAVAASTLAVAAIALVPSALGGGSGSAPSPTQVAQPGADEVYSFHVRWTGSETVSSAADSQDAVRGCLALPGVHDGVTLSSYPGQWAGEVTGRGNADALRTCVDAVAGWGVTVTPVDAAGGVRTYTVAPSMKLVLNPRLEQERDACFAIPGVDVVGQGESRPVIYRVTVPVAEATAFEQCIGSVVGLHVPELGQGDNGGGIAWTGAEICVGVRSGSCRHVDAETARALDALLLAAKPAPPGTAYCRAGSTRYRILFSHPTVRPVPIEVPHPCGPMKRGNQDYLLDDDARNAAKAAFETGTPPNVTATQPVSGTLRMTGGPAGTEPTGTSGEVTFEGPGGRTVARAAEDGSFSVELPAGTYQVTGTSPKFGGGAGVCHADAPVVVDDEPVTGVLVSCSRR